MKSLIVIISMLLIMNLSHARFAPENDLKIYADNNKSDSMDEAVFNSIIDRLEEIYAPVIAEKGANLKIIRKWEDPTVNAYAVPNGDDWEIHLFGGLARYDGMTRDGYATVVCHELGHHIGGAPKYTTWWGAEQWASTEGNSDYFATSKCMKLFLGWESTPQEQDQDQAQNLVVDQCDMYKSKINNETCRDIADAGEVLGRTLAGMSNQPLPSLETPDTLVIDVTNTTGYPSVQCRVDTYMRGALCDKLPESDTSDLDPDVGYCATGAGSRPACWYNPDALVPDYISGWSMF